MVVSQTSLGIHEFGGSGRALRHGGKAGTVALRRSDKGVESGWNHFTILIVWKGLVEAPKTFDFLGAYCEFAFGVSVI